MAKRSVRTPFTGGKMKLTKIDINNIGEHITGIAWRLKNAIADELLDDDYDALKVKRMKLWKIVEELDFAGKILESCTDDGKKEK